MRGKMSKNNAITGRSRTQKLGQEQVRDGRTTKILWLLFRKEQVGFEYLTVPFVDDKKFC